MTLCRLGGPQAIPKVLTFPGRASILPPTPVPPWAEFNTATLNSVDSGSRARRWMCGAEVDMARWVWVGERASDQMGPEGRGVVCYRDVVIVTCVK